MKNLLRFFLAFLTTFLVPYSGNAEGIRVINFRTGIDLSQETPVRVVEQDSVGLTVTYDFMSAAFEPDDLYEGTYWCRIDGFGEIYKESAPSLISRNDIFDLPANCSAPTVTLLSCQYTDIQIPITPSHPQLMDNSDGLYTKDSVKPIGSSIFVGSDSVVCIEGFSRQFSRSQLKVKISPMQYDLQHKTTRIYNKIKYRIDYTTPSVNFVDTRNSFDIEEPLPIDSLRPVMRAIRQSNKSYLIVTCGKYKEAVDSFVGLKHKFGIQTHVSFKDEWSIKDVSDSIRYYYSNMPNLEYVLLFGSYVDIPSMNYDSDMISDLCYTIYADENYSSSYQRAYIGRIPVRNNVEAKNVVDKIIEYTLYPPENEQFYKQGIHVSYFQGSSSRPTQDIRDYVRCSEYIKEYMNNLGFDVKRVYSSSTSNPQYWSDGTLVPYDLKSGTYNWNNNNYDIANAINAGAFYVFHRDHGDFNGWVYPSFRNRDLSLLSNSAKLPVVFSINCLTGKFDENECFAEKILKMKNFGCSAIFAATVPTYTVANNILAPGLFNCLYGGSGPIGFISEVPSPIGMAQSISNVELGRMLEVGLYRISELYPQLYDYHKYTYHIFGDPSMMMWTQVPSYVGNNEYDIEYKYVLELGKVVKKCSGININLDSDGFVVVYDINTRIPVLYSGRFGKLKNIDASKHKVYIYKPNVLIKEIDLTSSNTPISVKYFTLSPNPASSVCTIKYSLPSNYSTANFTITQVSSGSRVKEFMVDDSSNEISIDISNLPDGEYIVNMSANKSSTIGLNCGSEKLIVKH